jgi:uncharacterized membrane protein required for colicin V production
MNILDIIIVLIVVSAMVSGFRRGFVLGVYELLLIGAGIIFAAMTYSAIAGVLGRFLDFQPAVLNIAAFVIAILLFQMIASLTIGNIVRWSRRSLGYVPGVSIVDRVGGLLPGAVHGLLLATLIMLPIGYFATPDAARNQLGDSRFALPLYRESTNILLRAVSAAGLDLGDFVAVTPRQTDDGYVLPFRVTAGLTVDQSAEERMFQLVNEERLAAGLHALGWDPDLVPVARAHSEEMFETGYFSHYSPETGSPFDRLDAAGINYRAAGENLALAPTVDIAHQGLMDSPGHRENILQPAFGRMGIGAISSPGRGTMYTQLFRD